MKFALGQVAYYDWMLALAVQHQVRLRMGPDRTPKITAVVTPEDLRWYERDRIEQQPQTK